MGLNSIIKSRNGLPGAFIIPPALRVVFDFHTAMSQSGGDYVYG